MRKFKTKGLDVIEVDLDDSSTYEHLPQNTKELRQLMLSEIGYVHCYMYYWHKDIFNNGIGDEQRKRVENLIKDFTENEKQNYNNIMWYQEKVYVFQDEIENMC